MFYVLYVCYVYYILCRSLKITKNKNKENNRKTTLNF